MGLLLETWTIAPLLLLLSTAGLRAWAGTWMHGVWLFGDQAAQRVLENTTSQSGRISAAVCRGNLVAQKLFGGQQCFVILGPARITACVSSIYCISSQYLARRHPSQPMGPGARCRTNAEMSFSLDLRNDAIPLFQHKTTACPGDNCAVQQPGRLWQADGRADGLMVQQVGCLHAGKWCSAQQRDARGIQGTHHWRDARCSETEGLK